MQWRFEKVDTSGQNVVVPPRGITTGGEGTKILVTRALLVLGKLMVAEASGNEEEGDDGELHGREVRGIVTARLRGGEGFSEHGLFWLEDDNCGGGGGGTSNGHLSPFYVYPTCPRVRLPAP